ncbi:MAG TPA: aminoglycoside phosphotransferase family protein, partial [Micromonosporaceae bacterium]
MAEGGEDDWPATRAWVARFLDEGERIDRVELLRGGWTSRMRRLHVNGPRSRRALVLRSFVKPFFVRHAHGLLSREAAILRLLGGTNVPVPRLIAVDATADHCEHPSLLMTSLPGQVRLDDAGASDRFDLLARQLTQLHRVPVADRSRPREYQAWTTPDGVAVPHGADAALWRRAIAAIRREPPAYQPCLLHRDFHPGNVLFTGHGGDTRISGVVDWVEVSWGPADLDVAHCATALALLHGPEHGLAFADRYLAAGGHLSPHATDRLYWRLLDALAYAPDAAKVAGPWRELGRVDFTPAVLSGRLAAYLALL